MTLDLVLGNALLGTVGLALLHFVWQGALLALGLALTLRVLRPERAELRYALACGTLLLMAAAPPVTFGGLYWVVRGLEAPPQAPAMAVETPLSEDEPVDEARGGNEAVGRRAPSAETGFPTQAL